MSNTVSCEMVWHLTTVWKTTIDVDLDEVREWLVWSARERGQPEELGQAKEITNDVVRDFIECGDWNPEPEDQDPANFVDVYDQSIESVTLPGGD